MRISKYYNYVKEFKPYYTQSVHFRAQTLKFRERSQEKNGQNSLLSYRFLAAFIALTSFSLTSNQERNDNDDNVTYYSRDEVRKHSDMNSGVWVIYDNNVYDITNYVHQHPGGHAKILLAAGGEIAPYWNIYRCVIPCTLYSSITTFKI
jgi:cytochrome b involved in lipid metabolism